MSRTTKHHRPPGYEYWSRRPFANRGGAEPGRITKTLTNRKERRIAQRELDKTVEETKVATADDLVGLKRRMMSPGYWERRHQEDARQLAENHDHLMRMVEAFEKHFNKDSP